MASAELRILPRDATREQIVVAYNALLSVIQGNMGGRLILDGDSGDVKPLTGGAASSTGNFAQRIRSAIGKHLSIRHSAGTADTPANQVFAVEDDFVTVGRGKELRGYNAAGSNSVNWKHSGINDIWRTDDALDVGGAIASGAITSSGKVTGTQLESTIATGTAPLIVASTTKVPNLNADTLDDYDWLRAFTAALGVDTALNSATWTDLLTVTVTRAGWYLVIADVVATLDLSGVNTTASELQGQFLVDDGGGFAAATQLAHAAVSAGAAADPRQWHAQRSLVMVAATATSQFKIQGKTPGIGNGGTAKAGQTTLAAQWWAP